MKNKNGEAANEAIQTVKKLYEMIASEAQKIARPLTKSSTVFSNGKKQEKGKATSNK